MYLEAYSVPRTLFGSRQSETLFLGITHSKGYGRGQKGHRIVADLAQECLTEIRLRWI